MSVRNRRTSMSTNLKQIYRTITTRLFDNMVQTDDEWDIREKAEQAEVVVTHRTTGSGGETEYHLRTKEDRTTVVIDSPGRLGADGIEQALADAGYAVETDSREH